ncbi:MAG: hypothetical protein BroJett041_17930 [Candidatus Jettenia caeni]|nr:MAG: hypothetical protein BroJett041_17930 [Candidatus Jettenia caeni]GJQ45451.1 MAG: hypothetical protein JETCAE04_12050 [Candidatus Jettenia caeni]
MLMYETYEILKNVIARGERRSNLCLWDCFRQYSRNDQRGSLSSVEDYVRFHPWNTIFVIDIAEVAEVKV